MCNNDRCLSEFFFTFLEFQFRRLKTFWHQRIQLKSSSFNKCLTTISVKRLRIRITPQSLHKTPTAKSLKLDSSHSNTPNRGSKVCEMLYSFQWLLIVFISVSKNTFLVNIRGLTRRRLAAGTNIEMAWVQFPPGTPNFFYLSDAHDILIFTSFSHFNFRA